MESTERLTDKVNNLQQQIAQTAGQLRDLKLQLQQTETQLQAANDLQIAYEGGMPLGWQDETMAILSHIMPPQSRSSHSQQWPLAPEEYRRYGRQLIMPEIGLQGQLRLKQSKVLIVGAGGLGCPAATYLAGAGVGTLGLIDGDTVEVSNLHRQIAHSTRRVGMRKVDSAIEYLQGLNPTINCISHPSHLLPPNALQTIEPYDLVLDCTDHPTSRYLISDACVLLGKPLVTASALKTEGQLMVLNYPPTPPGNAIGGPCYRCVFPKPPPAESVISCGEGGILGPVVGTMGVLQALEAIKVITGPKNHEQDTIPKPTLLIFSAYSTPQFRTVRLRSRRKDCAACSQMPTITKDSLNSGSLDYVAFCGVTHPVKLLSDRERIDAKSFASRSSECTLIDVRDATQFELCNLPGSINVPFGDFQATLGRTKRDTSMDMSTDTGMTEQPSWLHNDNIAVICKLGNDSQVCVNMIKEAGVYNGNVFDIKGGFRAWKEQVDPTWPDY